MKRKNHRKPPKPKTWSSPKGKCRYCGKSIIENDIINKRKNWHTECLHLWFVISDPQYTRKYVWAKFEGICQGCGEVLPFIRSVTHNGISWKYEETWHVDHINPLIEADGNIDYWKPDNLNLLCLNCHKKKTIIENKERALKKRKTKID